MLMVTNPDKILHPAFSLWIIRLATV